jgi:hypothetical protein
VTEPGERLELFKFFASESLPGGVKREAGQQNLITLSERLHPGAGVDLQAVEVPGFSGSFFLVEPDFPDVDPNSIK